MGVEPRYVLFVLLACTLAGVGIQVWVSDLVAQRTLLERRPIPYWEFPPDFELQTQSFTRMHAVTCIHYTTEEELIFTTKYNHKAAVAPAAADTHPFPAVFYDGAVYGVSAWHQKNTIQSSKANDVQTQELLYEIQNMYPKPKLVVPFSSIDRETDFYERGFALHFDIVSREVELAVLALGRVFGQVQVTKWWGHAWGHDPRHHVTVMQGLVPVASALWPIKTESPIRLAYPTTAEQRFFADHWRRPTGGDGQLHDGHNDDQAL